MDSSMATAFLKASDEYNGVVFKLKEHIDRLYRSAHAIMLQIPLTKEEMTKAVVETLRKNNMNDSYIRLVVSRGVGDLGLDPRKCPKPTIIIITDTINIKAGNAKEVGITTMFSWVRRNPVDATTHEIKSLNYLNSVLAKIEANASGVDEAILPRSERLHSGRSRRKHLHRQKRRNLYSTNFNRRSCRHHRRCRC